MKEEAMPASAASNSGGHSASFESDSRDLNSHGDHFKGHNSKHRMDKSFFKSWKLPKIGKTRGGGHSIKTSNNNNHNSQPVDLLLTTEDQVLTSQENILAPVRDTEDTTDEILNKYRSKPSNR